MAKTKGAKGYTEAERDVIRLGLRNGMAVVEIARFMGRSRPGVYKAINAMVAAGTLGQGVANLGQLGGAHERA